MRGRVIVCLGRSLRSGLHFYTTDMRKSGLMPVRHSLTDKAATDSWAGGALYNRGEGGPSHRESMVDLYSYYNFLAVEHLSLTKSYIYIL